MLLFRRLIRHRRDSVSTLLSCRAKRLPRTDAFHRTGNCTCFSLRRETVIQFSLTDVTAAGTLTSNTLPLTAISHRRLRCRSRRALSQHNYSNRDVAASPKMRRSTSARGTNRIKRAPACIFLIHSATCEACRQCCKVRSLTPASVGRIIVNGVDSYFSMERCRLSIPQGIPAGLYTISLLHSERSYPCSDIEKSRSQIREHGRNIYAIPAIEFSGRLRKPRSDFISSRQCATE